MRDHSDDFKELRSRLAEAERYLDLAGLRARQATLQDEVAKPDLWDDADNARQVTTEFTQVNDDVDLLEGLTARIDDAETLRELAV